MKSLVALIFSATLLSLYGCASSGSAHRGKLSEAMEKASDENNGSRQVQPDGGSSYRRDDDTSASWIARVLSGGDSSVASMQPAVMISETPEKKESLQGWFSIAAGTGIISEKAFYGLDHVNLRIGTYTSEHARIEMSGGIGWAPVQQSNTLSHSIDGGVLLLNAGFQANWYTTPKYTFLGNYFLAGGSYNYMMWRYRNAIYSGFQRITDDAIDGVELYGGVGFNLVQTSFFQLGGEVTPGIVFWVGDTREGFTNDVFGPFSYVKFKAVVNFGW
jgi:hypothetical protein